MKFLDETGCNQAMSREYARSVSGERAVGKVPETRGDNITIIAVLGTEGIVSSDRFDKPMNQFTFCFYIENNLSKNWNNDDFLVMDNVSFHKTPLVRKTLDKYNIKYIYLPPYYPTLNPIELFWSMLKAFLKSIKPRTKNEIFMCIHEWFRRIKNIDPFPFFKKCGYLLLDIIKPKFNLDFIGILEQLAFGGNAS